MLKRVTDEPTESRSDPRPRALVIGAGIGGLSAAMRLGAKGYRVTVLDRLDEVGGRASTITQNGHRFDLGPTIVTVPKVFEELWAACGRDFHADVDLRPMDPFYEIPMRAEVARLSPNDAAGYDKFLSDSFKRYEFGFEDLGRRSFHQLWELIKVLPRFAWLRADRSVYGHAAKRFADERLRMAFSFHPLFIDVYTRLPSRKRVWGALRDGRHLCDCPCDGQCDP